METRGRTPVVVIGGGLSGLAAAVRLSAAGIPVHLLEQRPMLGGRARSYTDSTTGDEVDNGQHLLIAGYSHTLDFLDRVGARHLIDVQKNPLLPFHHPLRGFARLSIPLLPSPFHLAWGIARTSLLSPGDRLNLLKGGLSLMRRGPDEEAGQTITEWLDRHHQSPEVQRSFWGPLAVAIMNETPDRASARLFCDSLRQAFLRQPHDAALVFPRVGLSTLFAGPARAFIEQRGGTVQCNADVRHVSTTNGKATEIVLRYGTVIPCAAAILAVPAPGVPRLIPNVLISGLTSLADWQMSPIIGIHLWMDAGFMRDRVIGLIGRRIQWVFRRERHLSLVISAARECVDLSNRALVSLALEDLRGVFGEAVGLPTHAVVIREKRATFSATPQNSQKRPGPGTPLPNLFIAGDWTDTGLPATIEGAILSGQKAAALASDSLRFM